MSDVFRDGVRLWYTEAGAGDPPLLFVHGWCGDHTYFASQFEHFRKAHRVVAVDLRGHGRSDKPEQDYTIECFAEDLVCVVRKLELRDLVVVGHSMGAIAGVEAAATHPGVIAALVLVDPASVVWVPEVKEAATAFLELIRGTGYRDAMRQYVTEALFLPTDDAALKERVADAMCATPQHVMVSELEHIISWDGERAATACNLPMLAISAANPIGDIDELRKLCPSLVTGQTVGAGHFNQLLVPEQVNAMIERFLETASLRVSALTA